MSTTGTYPAPAGAVAQSGPSPQVEGLAGAQTDASGAAAVFNPFSSIGVVSPTAGEMPAAIQLGDWTMPLAAALLGLACIGILLRKLVD